MAFAEILREHWPRYLEQARGPIPSRAWAAVEAVLSCRTKLTKLVEQVSRGVEVEPLVLQAHSQLGNVMQGVHNRSFWVSG